MQNTLSTNEYIFSGCGASNVYACDWRKDIPERTELLFNK